MKKIFVVLFVFASGTLAFSFDADKHRRLSVYLGPYLTSGSSLDTGFNFGVEVDWAVNDKISPCFSCLQVV
jgi:hypothetical protein